MERFMTGWYKIRITHLGPTLLLCGLLTSCASGIETPILVETNPAVIASAEPMEEITPTPSDLDLQLWKKSHQPLPTLISRKRM